MSGFATMSGIALALAASTAIVALLLWRKARLAKSDARRTRLLNRLHAAHSHIDRAIIRGHGRGTLFIEACRIALAQGGFRVAMIGLVDAGAPSFEIAACEEAEPGCAQPVLNFFLGLPGQGGSMTGVLTGGSQVIVDDLGRDPRTAPWGAEAQRLGLHSLAALPIRDGGRFIGVFVVCSDEPGFFGRREAAILGEVADDLGFALEQMDVAARHHAAEAMLRESNRDLESRLAERTAELQMVNKELDAFSYSVSHELHSPLCAIDGYSRLLEEDFGDSLGDLAKRLLGVIRDSSYNMRMLINDLLTFSRLGRQPISAAQIDMTGIVNEAWLEACASWPDAAPAFRLHALPVAWGDPALLKHVWTNLLSNAVKYSGKRERPVIEVSGEDRGGEVVCCVKDNGAGFDMRHYDKLFNACQRLHSASEFPGTGVGLAIVQRAVTRHGGRVWADSRVDDGASFFFSLPGPAGNELRHHQPGEPV